MNTEKSSGGLNIAWVILGIIGVVVIVVISMLLGANSSANSYEKIIKATYLNNQNILSNYGAKLAEAAQIPQQYKKDFLDVMKAEMEGRYGPSDKAHSTLANFVTERQLSFDSSLYTKLQEMIEAGRNEFQNGQTSLLDKKRAYETALDNIPSGNLMRAMGWPTINFDDYKTIVTEDTQRKFEQGTDAPVKVFGN
jgi:hypothetical protein